MVRAPQGGADQSHGGGDGKAVQVQPGGGARGFPDAGGEQARRRAAQAGEHRCPAVWRRCLSASPARDDRLRDAAEAIAAAACGGRTVRRHDPSTQAMKTAWRTLTRASMGPLWATASGAVYMIITVC